MEGARCPNPRISFYTEGTWLADRIWYHVPRAGDSVTIADQGWIVEQIFWRDDCIIIELTSD